MRLAPPVAALLLMGCLEGERVRGNVPFGTTPLPGTISAEAFLRRAFSDLHGVVPAPSDPRWTRALALLTGGVTPAARAQVAELLIADRAYADAFFDEHATPAFSALGGLEGAYRFLLYYVDELIGMSANPEERRFLASYRDGLAAERDELRALPERLQAGALDEAALIARVARSTAAFVLSGPEAYARFLFQHLLGRSANEHELRNAAAMARIAAFVGPDAAPSGTVLRREGKHLDDLVQILIESDAFLEARVRALCLRLLGRPPSAAEVWGLLGPLRDARRRGQLSAGYRQLLATLVSSGEYSRP